MDDCSVCVKCHISLDSDNQEFVCDDCLPHMVMLMGIRLVRIIIKNNLTYSLAKKLLAPWDKL